MASAASKIMPPDTTFLPDSLCRGVEEALDTKIIHAAPVVGGYTPARRLRLSLGDGRRVFVKAATTEKTAMWLRTEAQVYDALAGSVFLAERIAWHDKNETFLVLEDLSAAHWPPPWTTAQIDRICTALSAVATSRSKVDFPLARIEDDRESFASWHRVAQEPEPFLSLGLCSDTWLHAVLPTLIDAESAAPLAGDALLHHDIRSDNVCFRPGSGEAVLVDWNWVCAGNPDLDIAGWLPSLQSEGGPPPETILPHAGELAAILSGFWAYRAGTPPPEGAPSVREVQRRQLLFALPWAARALDLPPPDIR
jgi:hypothetical protein